MPMPRHFVIVCSVILFHVAGLWALQSGLLRRVVEVVIPAQVINEMLSPPRPETLPPPPPPPKQTPQTPPPVAPTPATLPPAPQPVAIADPSPAPQAPTGTLQPQPVPAPITTPVAPAPVATPVAPVAPKVELPSSDADYLQNPRPAYPAMSKRLGEQGKVVVRVLIGADGIPQKAEIRTSSTFDRLDQAALATVMKWRYVPGKRGGVAEAMWFNVPISFVLE